MAYSTDGSIIKLGQPLGVAQIITISYVGLIRPRNILWWTKMSQRFCHVSCHFTYHINCHVTCHVISFYDEPNRHKILGASSATSHAMSLCHVSNHMATPQINSLWHSWFDIMTVWIVIVVCDDDVFVTKFMTFYKCHRRCLDTDLLWRCIFLS